MVKNYSYEIFTAIIVGMCAMGMHMCTPILNRPSLSKILSLGAPESSSAEAKKLDYDGLVDALKAEWISPFRHDAPEEDDMRRAVQTIRHEDFWRTYFFRHSNKGRVKNWMGLHVQYRNQLDKLLSETDRSKAQEAFDKWCKTRAGHSDFEGEMLYRYFLDNIPSEAMDKNLKVLMEHHSDYRDQEDKIARMLASGDGGKWEKKLKSYVDAMLDHLKLEEQTIVGPWLNLDSAEYKRYRSYLNWNYAVTH